MSSPYAFPSARLAARREARRFRRRTQVEDGLALLELGKRRRVAASERGEQRFGRNTRGLAFVVQVRGDRIPRLGGRSATARWNRNTMRRFCLRYPQCRLSVLLFHVLFRPCTAVVVISLSINQEMLIFSSKKNQRQQTSSVINRQPAVAFEGLDEPRASSRASLLSE